MDRLQIIKCDKCWKIGQLGKSAVRAFKLFKNHEKSNLNVKKGIQFREIV